MTTKWVEMPYAMIKGRKYYLIETARDVEHGIQKAKVMGATGRFKSLLVGDFTDPKGQTRIGVWGIFKAQRGGKRQVHTKGSPAEKRTTEEWRKRVARARADRERAYTVRVRMRCG